MTFRLLPTEEWPRLLADGIEPFASLGQLPDPQHWLIVVAEQDGRIQAVSMLQEAVLNHWYIQPDARRSPTLVSKLWQKTAEELTARGVEVLHATVSDTQPEVQDMVERLGYQQAPGKVYALHVPDCILSEA